MLVGKEKSVFTTGKDQDTQRKVVVCEITKRRFKQRLLNKK